jgi:hypothetical protein
MTCFRALAIFVVAATASAQNGPRPGWAAAPPARPGSAPDIPVKASGVSYNLRNVSEWKVSADQLAGQSKYGEAEKLYAKVLEEREHALGLNSPELVADLSDLGRVNFAQMKFGMAEAAYGRALQILEVAKGRNNIELVPILNQLVKVTRAANNLMGAEQFAQRALAITERYKGAEHPDVAGQLLSVARLQILQQTPAKAVPLLQRALAVQEKAGGALSPELIPILDSLGEAAKPDSAIDAEAYWRRSLAIRESHFGPVGLEVCETLDLLGLFFFEQRNWNKAGEALERALFIRNRLLGAEHPATQESGERVAAVYAAQGRAPDAQPLVKQIFTAKEQDTAHDLNTLAKQADSENRLSEAESFYKASIAVLDKRGLVSARYPALDPSDPPSPALIETLDNYTALLKKMNKKKDARKIELRANLLASRGPLSQRK